ncbi:Lrp/AsnC ligand binding domain-containing protein [Thermococcus paralvinellae]|uniref:Transcription regulator AsnC/Lrp ligand binding domain-containing protein n=1 Tax=Thermococcus paralvinellae TaxID=582419 RepID=W0I3N1_9EURY|nr:Lrp/AsnC ligand binding domain-containing protein [Thermococcus paralvinellae]AHF80644.1 Hypothetical protein TES1_1262 [Thermococcus paralvinellae]
MKVILFISVLEEKVSEIEEQLWKRGLIEEIHQIRGDPNIVAVVNVEDEGSLRDFTLEISRMKCVYSVRIYPVAEYHTKEEPKEYWNSRQQIWVY